MKLQAPDSKQEGEGWLRRMRARRVVLFAGIVVLACVMFIAGFYFHRKLYEDDRYLWLIKLAKENITLVPRMLEGLQAQPQRLEIGIKYKHFMNLAHQREVALQRGTLILNDSSYVPATLRFDDNQTIKAKIRLKGDRLDHLFGDKWSFRVRVSGEETLWGMKQFSLHHPKARNYIYEWIYHQALKREDVQALRYLFVDLTVNGKDLGVYALEEHFEKRLVENNHRVAAPIIRFNEDMMWDENVRQRNEFPDAERTGSGDYLSSDIDAFQTGKILADSLSMVYFKKAMYLLEAFRRGELTTSQVFDTKRLATYFAVTDLCGAEHGSRWHNMRFYYNPYTALLEPIGFDGNSGKSLREIEASRSGLFIREYPKNASQYYLARMFADDQFFAEYVRALERFSKPAYLDSLFQEIDEELKQNLAILYQEFPYYEFSKEILYRNQRYIAAVLNPVKGIQAYLQKVDAQGIHLQMGAIQSLPVEVVSLKLGDAYVLWPPERTILPAKSRLEPVRYQHVLFPIPPDFAWNDSFQGQMQVLFKILGGSRIMSVEVFPWPYLDMTLVKNDLVRRPANFHRFSFIHEDRATRRLVIQPGTWTLRETLIFPPGYMVVCHAGTTLRLQNGASLVSFSPVEFVGEQTAPILIESPDSTGQGLAVLQAGGRSSMRHLIFRNLSSPKAPGWELPGAVTIYESPVDFAWIEIENARAAQAIEIARNAFTIERMQILHALQGGLRATYSRGQLSDIAIYDCGTQGLKATGSMLELHSISVKQTGFSGLVVEAASLVTARDLRIARAKVGLIAKDKSHVRVQDSDLAACHIGIAVFQEKAEFDAARVEVQDVSLSEIQEPYLVEERSTIILNGESIQQGVHNVKNRLIELASSDHHRNRF